MYNLFCFFVFLFSGIIFCACSNNDTLLDNEVQNEGAVTQTRAKNFHWTCTKCKFSLNGGWLNYCSQCGESFSEAHGKLILSFVTSIQKPVGTTKIPDNNENKLQLPGLIYPIIAPTPWYDSPKAVKFYENLKTLYYHSNLEYAEGVDIGWYRTTRAIFPEHTNLTEIERLHGRFIISDGTALKGPKGSGIKAAIEAAIEGYSASR